MRRPFNPQQRAFRLPTQGGNRLDPFARKLSDLRRQLEEDRRPEGFSPPSPPRRFSWEQSQ